MNPDLTTYIQTARSAGANNDQIRQVLIAAGWQAEAIDAGLASEPVAAQAVDVTKHRFPMVLFIGILIILIALMSTAAFFFYPRKKVAVNTPVTTSTTATFTQNDLTFKYNSDWIMTGTQELVLGNKGSGKSELAHYFFTSTAWSKVKSQIDAGTFSNDPTENSLLMSAALQSEVTVTSVPNTTAEAVAYADTQTICTGDTISSSNSNPINTKRVDTFFENNFLGYVVYPEKECSYHITTISLNASGITYVISFNNTTNLTDLSADQATLFHSLELK